MSPIPSRKYTLQTDRLSIFYDNFCAVEDVSVQIEDKKITAIIGPSGCGKSTLLRSFNRMNDLVPCARVQGEVRFAGHNIYNPGVDPVSIRRQIGMVFQKPNPFPKSIYENVAWGWRIHGARWDNDQCTLDDWVEHCLRKAALWEEVKDKLKHNALSLSGGQQQRLCIARAIAIQPRVILMDEPASALDPIATLKIEELMRELAREFTIVVVTHNMQQAARVSDDTMFLTVNENRSGVLVEYGPTSRIFTNPRDARTEGYITGRYG
jgi:phosphate transport system ATP-binding protein